MKSNIIIVKTEVHRRGNEKTLENGYYPEDSEVYVNSSPAMQRMLDLQNKITDSLIINNGKYVYNYERIKTLIYNFDFTELNKEIDESLSPNRFLEMVVYQLENVNMTVNRQPSYSTFAYTQGPMCGVNKIDSIWNSKREYRDYSRTQSHAKQLMDSGVAIQYNAANMTATGWSAIVAGVAVWSPVIAGTMKAIKHGYSGFGLWMRTVSTSLTNSNAKNTCGTVLDINIVQVFSTWNQKDN